MFIDAFNSLRKFIKSVLGVYAALGNLPHRLRALALHIFTLSLASSGEPAMKFCVGIAMIEILWPLFSLLCLVSFSPPAADPLGALLFFVEEVLQLQRGRLLSLGSLGDVFVIGGVGCITADFPEGNSLADCKSHNASAFCRRCMRLHTEISLSEQTAPALPRTEHEQRARQETLQRLLDLTTLYVL